jgi:LDH2 family malate/lactate/ureidoglycolate dehydrogenase
VLVPGDPEQIMEDERLKNGIPIAEAIYRFLKNEN